MTILGIKSTLRHVSSLSRIPGGTLYYRKITNLKYNKQRTSEIKVLNMYFLKQLHLDYFLQASQTVEPQNDSHKDNKTRTNSSKGYADAAKTILQRDAAQIIMIKSALRPSAEH